MEAGDAVELEKRQRAVIKSLRDNMSGVWSSDAWWWRWLLLLSLLALATRMSSLDQPSGTAWDEVHFGGFGNMYINRTYFHDVHPPLGKMLVAGALYLTGYQGTFSFHINTLYPQDFHLATVRAMFGVLGSALVPLSFLTVWELTGSIPAAVIAAVAMLTDHYMHRLCTLILLDGPLILGILASVYCSIRFHNTKEKVWSRWWWVQLSATGVCLGTIMSIKYIAVFTVVFVGLHTAYQLVIILTEPNKSMWLVVPHTAARALCLILLPLGLYLATFVLHFAVLNKWMPDSGGFYHTRFTSSFDNTEYDNKFFPKYLDYGANITLKNNLAMSGYLESWYDLFPSAFTAPCQQITLTTLKDSESITWTLRFVNVTAGQVEDTNGVRPEGRRVVHNGDHIVLTHQATGRSMRTHGHRAPITRRHFQVCGYGDDGEAGPFETWQILVPGMAEGTPIETLGTDFLLMNFKMNCYLANPGNTDLPNWAFQSAKEVTCTRNREAHGLLWHVNWVNATRLPLTRTAREYSMSLWEKIVHQHEAMMLGNSGLRPKKEDLQNSARPWMWPLLYRLQVLCVYTVDAISRHLNATVTPTDSLTNSTIPTPSHGANNTTSLTTSTIPTTSHGANNTTSLTNSTIPTPSHGANNTTSVTVSTNSTNQSKDSVSSHKTSTSESESIDEDFSLNHTTPEPNDYGILAIPDKVNRRSRKAVKQEIYAIFMHNPVVAYINLLSFGLTVALVLQHFYKIFRKTEEAPGVFERRERTVMACFWISTCWALHYFPFFVMVRVLYTHHYCPAYCYSCMLTGVILGHMCESLSDWLNGKGREPLLTCLVLVPLTLFIASYCLLFPFATVLQGRFAYPHATLEPYLDVLNFGQPWVELGYSPDDGTFVITTRITELNTINYANIDVNATLYYNTSLYTGPILNPVIEPVAASNYTTWKTPSVTYQQFNDTSGLADQSNNDALNLQEHTGIHGDLTKESTEDRGTQDKGSDETEDRASRDELENSSNNTKSEL